MMLLLEPGTQSSFSQEGPPMAWMKSGNTRPTLEMQDRVRVNVHVKYKRYALEIQEDNNEL